MMTIGQYMDLIDETVGEVLNEVQSKNDYQIIKLNHFNYLGTFINNLDKIKKHSSTACPDSFIVASCLADALLQHHLLTFDINKNTPKDVLLINYRVALEVALKVASKPITYYFDIDIKGWLPTVHPEVEMNIPERILHENNLKTRIIQHMSTFQYNGEISKIMLFADLLHIIYQLNSK